MNLHDFLLILQSITVVFLFIEIIVVFTRWKNAIHSYLFLACISSFISNLGYLMQLRATTEEAYLSALKLSYVGRVWIVFAFFLFTARLCRVKLPRGLMTFLVLLHIGIYLAVVTIGYSTLYYKTYSFVPDPLFPKFFHTNGVMHDFFMLTNVLLVIVAMNWILREFHREKNAKSKKRLFFLISAFGVQILSFLLHVTGVFGISRFYDLTMTGALFGTALMLIAILRFDLLGTREIARDFAIDRISEGIIAVDNDGRIQYFNEPAARIYPEFRAFFSGKEGFGASSAEEDGEDAAEDGTKKRSFSRHNYTPYDILSFITDAVEKDEMLKVGDRIYSPEVNDLVFRGEQYGKLYALVDDTEHFRYMEELQKQRDIADKANAAKSKFLASMSHEIRTPINAVLGMDEMILRESSEKPIRAYASDIMSAGKTLLSLINDILDLSKIEEGKMEILPVQYDLSSLINDLVNMTRPRAVKKGLQFHVEAEEQVPHLLFGDEIRIRQCAMNILTNAVKYTEKGDVWLKISFEKEDDAHIQLRFSVKDTGIGMKKEDMEVLFSPYRRIEEKRNRAIEGTGLGMSITKQLLDLMDSSLEVESEYGKGSVFSFAVSQKVVKWEALGDYSDRFNGTEEQAGQYRELFHAPDARILVVDDTEMNLAVICSLLKKTCIVIDTAASGREALVMAEQTRYDLVFIDHMMPEMDGIETLQHMREGGACKEVPAIALTANAVSGAREMYLAAGFADYVSKPVDGERLEHLLADMLPAEKVLPPDSEISAAAENAADLSASDGVNVSAGAGAEPAGAGSDGLSPDRLMQNLQEIPEIDAAAGLKNCGDAEGYLNVLKVFHGTAGAKAQEIEDLYHSGDISGYTIKVHALKSSARIIGAAELSALAKSLEDAGKEGNTGFIGAHTERLLHMYRALDDKLRFLDPDKEDLPGILPEALQEAYRTIQEIAGAMDYGLLEDLLKDLRGYRLPEEDDLRIGRIESLLTNLDFEGIARIAGETEEG